MPEIAPDAKAKIDSLSLKELRDQVALGQTSVYQGEKMAYIKQRERQLTELEQARNRKEDLGLETLESSVKEQPQIASPHGVVLRVHDRHRRLHLALLIVALWALVVTFLMYLGRVF